MLKFKNPSMKSLPFQKFYFSPDLEREAKEKKYFFLNGLMTVETSLSDNKKSLAFTPLPSLMALPLTKR